MTQKPYLDGYLTEFYLSDKLTKDNRFIRPYFDPLTEKIISSDRSILLIAPKNYFYKSYNPLHASLLEYAKVIPVHNLSEIQFSLDYKKIKDEAIELPIISEFLMCKRCEGAGSLFTKSGNPVDCGTCDEGREAQIGARMIPRPESWRRGYNENKPVFCFQIGTLYFDCNYIMSLANIANALQDQINFCLLDLVSVIYIGDIQIILRPLNDDDDLKEWIAADELRVIKLY